MGNPEDDGGTQSHLVVMIHGFWGNPTHLNHLRDELIRCHPKSGIKTFVPASNRDNNTYDGIEVGAERITHEILQEIQHLKQSGHDLRRFSIVGYSLGGLIARYVVGLLFANGTFDTLTPINFTTFASPHLGVRSPKKGYQVDTWNWLGSNLLSVSGQQLYLTDSFRDTDRPLLAVMADPSSIFIKGLKLFQSKSIFANVHHDPAVPFYTAAFCKHDPYVDLDAVDVHYMPSKDGDDQRVILDPKNPVSRKKNPGSEVAQQQAFYERYIMSERTRNSLPFYAFVATAVPLGIPFLLANAGYQTYQSAARVKAHETGSAMDLKAYRLPLLEQSQHLQDKVVESLANGSFEETLDEGGADDKEWPTLALTRDQFEMIKTLDSLDFVKYHCYLQVRRAHAGIIVRVPNDAFKEGKVVTHFWASNFTT